MPSVCNQQKRNSLFQGQEYLNHRSYGFHNLYSICSAPVLFFCSQRALILVVGSCPFIWIKLYIHETCQMQANSKGIWNLAILKQNPCFSVSKFMFSTKQDKDWFYTPPSSIEINFQSVKLCSSSEWISRTWCKDEMCWQFRISLSCMMIYNTFNPTL